MFFTFSRQKKLKIFWFGLKTDIVSFWNAFPFLKIMFTTAFYKNIIQEN